MIRREEFGGVIYDDGTGKLYNLNPVAFRALEMHSQEKLNINDIHAGLKKEFGDVPKMAELKNLIKVITEKFSNEALSLQVGRKDDDIWDGKSVSDVTHFIAPAIIFWIFTNKCNLRCTHCVQDSGCAYENELSVDECKKIIDQFHKMGVAELSFSGGEPLCRKKDLIEIGKYAKNLGFKLSIATNGVLVTPKLAKELRDAGFKYAQVSIEGSKVVHDSVRGEGAFDKAVRGIKNLVKENFSVMLATTVSNFNKDDLHSVIDLAKLLGVTGVRFVRFLPMGRGLQNIDKFSISKDDELKVAEYLWREKWKNIGQIVMTFNKHYASYGMKVAPEVSGLDEFKWRWDCPAGRMRASVMPTGEITACPLIGSLGLSAGNVRTHDFDKLWFDSAFFNSFRKEKEDCIGCQQWEICKGGCKAWSYAKHGNLTARDPLCFVD